MRIIRNIISVIAFEFIFYNNINFLLQYATEISSANNLADQISDEWEGTQNWICTVWYSHYLFYYVNELIYPCEMF